MSFDKLREILSHASPSFRCYYAGDRTEQLRFTAHMQHILGKPATATALAQLDSQLGDAGIVIRELYAIHDGMTLYCDTKSDAAGFELFPIADWQTQTADMRESMEAMGMEVDEMPGWFSSGVVVGQIPHSANYFVIGTTDDDSGKIFYMDHDDFIEEPIADSVELLIDALLADPAQFLYDRGCYTRYSDGKTDRQWIPKQYLNEASS